MPLPTLSPRLWGLLVYGGGQRLLVQKRDNGADLTKVCVSLVTNISYLFANKNQFDQDIGSWDVSNVTNMQGTFSNAMSFNQDTLEVGMYRM